ncbi:M55 family metallopeptidase [Yinghuangia aomiensis]
MRVLISADMEGATGTVLPADVTSLSTPLRALPPDADRRRQRRRGGFAAAGAERGTWSTTRTGGMDNVLLEDLDPRANLIVGRHKPLGMMQGIELGVDAVAFVGYHTGAGEQGVLAHTYLSAQHSGRARRRQSPPTKAGSTHSSPRKRACPSCSSPATT